MGLSILEIHRILPEFPLEKVVWYHYHQQEANPDEDRIFGTFFDGTNCLPLRGAGCTPTGTKSTAFSPWKSSVGVAFRGLSCRHEIDACGHEEMYMHSTLQLISFYKTFGFVPLPEDQLPKMIRERFHLPLRRDGRV